MIPDNIDIPDLSAQLGDDRVAFAVTRRHGTQGSGTHGSGTHGSDSLGSAPLGDTSLGDAVLGDASRASLPAQQGTGAADGAAESVAKVSEDAAHAATKALNDELVAAVAYADERGFGPTGVVVLDQTPAHTADLRDIGQTLLDGSDGLETVVVRSPHSGAIVSTVHNRSELESAQFQFLDNPDIPSAMRQLVDDVISSGVPWPIVALVFLVVAAAVVAVTVIQAGRRLV